MPIFSPIGSSGFALVGSHAFKKGTAAGNYTSTSTTFAAIDATNLNVTLGVPTGMVALATFCCTAVPQAGKTTRVAIEVDSTITSYQLIGGSLVSDVPLTVQALLVGDGSNHTFSPQIQIDSGGTGTIINQNETTPPNAAVPTLTVIIFSAS